jgi:hypothetical protein
MRTWNEIEADLRQPVDESKVHSYDGDDGKTLYYLDGSHIRNKCDEIFGTDGWERRTTIHGNAVTVQVTVSCLVDKEANQLLRIVREGSSGFSTHNKISTAETKAFHRALSTFGDPFGACLYDETFTTTLKNTQHAPGAESHEDSGEDEANLELLREQAPALYSYETAKCHRDGVECWRTWKDKPKTTRDGKQYVTCKKCRWNYGEDGSEWEYKPQGSGASKKTPSKGTKGLQEALNSRKKNGDADKGPETDPAEEQNDIPF